MASPPAGLLRSCVGHGRRLVLVHGFTQTGASWHRIGASLAARYEVCTVDLPGHGRASEVRTDSLEATATLLGASTGSATYLGYSLGGRVCLTLALEHPELVERLILVGATLGIDDANERAARRRADEDLAARLDPGNSAVGLSLEHFLEEWLAGPLFAHLDAEQADVASRLENTPAGLAASLRTTGTGTQRPSRARLGALRMPTLLVAGARDERFATLAAEMAVCIGENARAALVEGAGHAACFERPDAFLEVLETFLDPSAG